LEKLSVLDRIIRDAARFHGHMGPFLVLGVKAGLRAVETLGFNPFEMKAKIITKKSTPYTCFADGVQFTTGCTLGKGNIEIVDGVGLKAVFSLQNRSVELTVKEEILREAENSKEPLEKISLKFMRMSLMELFEEKLI